MVVVSTDNFRVSIEHTDKKSLFDSRGVEWKRDPSKDQEGFAAYTESVNNVSTILLDLNQLKVVCGGDRALNTPTTVEEMRYYSRRLHPKRTAIVDKWPDQRLREILIEGEEKGKHPGELMDKYTEDELPKEAPRKPTEEPRTPRRYISTPKTPKRAPVAREGLPVALTAKQLIFMQRLDSYTAWEGPDSEGIASEYAEEISDELNAMAVGAVITTLRQKGVITTNKTKTGCYFRLTGLGVEVYNALKEVKDDSGKMA